MKSIYFKILRKERNVVTRENVGMKRIRYSKLLEGHTDDLLELLPAI